MAPKLVLLIGGLSVLGGCGRSTTADGPDGGQAVTPCTVADDCYRAYGDAGAPGGFDWTCGYFVDAGCAPIGQCIANSCPPNPPMAGCSCEGGSVNINCGYAAQPVFASTPCQ